MQPRKHRGIALLTAIWVMTVLLILLGGFAAMTHGATLVARNHGDRMRARWAARAGLHRAEAHLAEVVAQPYTDFGDTTLSFTSDDENDTTDETAYTVTVMDEAGKVNINTASAEELRLFFDADVADAIVDWRDSDSSPGEQGAEDDYYAALTSPYHCKNAPFETVRELLQVKGVTAEMLATAVTDDGLTLEQLLTTCSTDANTAADSNRRLDIRSANQQAWQTRCGDVLTEDEITAIITRRTSSAFRSPADLLRVPNLSREKVAQIYDRLTATDAQQRAGLINLNTAPAAVLAVLPEIDETSVQAIISRRTEQPFTDVGELLTMESISNELFAQIADQVTTRSQRFQVTATGDNTSGISCELTCILQAAMNGETVEIHTLYWRE